jgi:hypothetical protein
MSTHREKLLQTLDAVDGDIRLAADIVYDGPKTLAIYAIKSALEHLKARKRATRRREIRSTAQLRVQAGRTTGSIVLTPKSKRKLLEMTQVLFGEDGWQIGEINLGNFTKEGLLQEAAKERRSAKGHVRNAMFYEALAEPMEAGQMVKDYWEPKTATKIKKEIWKDTERAHATLA